MFEEIIENAYYPMTIGGEHGSLAVPENIDFRPEDYTFHPLMNAAVVLALPLASADSAGAVSHIFTRQVWAGTAALTEKERESPTGVVWYHHVSLELTLETRETPEWPNGEKYLTIALCGSISASTTVNDECTKVTRRV
jgi:hypothetical protein